MDLAPSLMSKNVIKARRTARTGKTAKARILMIRNGNSLTDTIRNMRQEEEEAKDAQPNYGSRSSPPYYLKYTHLSL